MGLGLITGAASLHFHPLAWQHLLGHLELPQGPCSEPEPAAPGAPGASLPLRSQLCLLPRLLQTKILLPNSVSCPPHERRIKAAAQIIPFNPFTAALSPGAEFRIPSRDFANKTSGETSWLRTALHQRGGTRVLPQTLHKLLTTAKGSRRKAAAFIDLFVLVLTHQAADGNRD